MLFIFMWHVVPIFYWMSHVVIMKKSFFNVVDIRFKLYLCPRAH